MEDGDGREAHGSLFSHAFGAQDFNGIKPPSPLEVVVECTLNEIYNGCSKRVTYKRTVLNKDGRTTKDLIESKYACLIMKTGTYKSSRESVTDKLSRSVSWVMKWQAKKHVLDTNITHSRPHLQNQGTPTQPVQTKGE